MDTVEQICREVANNPHVMTFRDIGQAMAKGALAGHKSGVAGGAVTGAVLGVSLEAGERVVLLLDSLSQQSTLVNRRQG